MDRPADRHPALMNTDVSALLTCPTSAEKMEKYLLVVTELLLD